VSTSVCDFKALLLGYYFAERLSESGQGDGDLPVFLKWEQLAAYARWDINDDKSFRGTERTGNNLQAGGKVRLGADQACQILSNQKTYGLWGLYTVPARSSGLIAGNPTRLTEPARHLVESVYIPMLSNDGIRSVHAIARLLAQRHIDLYVAGRDRPLIKSVAKVLRRRLLKPELEVFRKHLLLGGPEDNDRTHGGQAVLTAALKTTFHEQEWWLTPARVLHLAKVCRGYGDEGHLVADRLERIRTCEFLLAPSVFLYGLLLGSDGQTLSEVAGDARRQWGGVVRTINVDQAESLETELKEALGDDDAGSRWLRIARALADGKYEEVLRLLIDQNRYVMKARNGAAPWVELRVGKLHVLYRDDRESSLPEGKDLPNLWIHSYFLDSLRSIALELRD
jgi:hypothetical protein